MKRHLNLTILFFLFFGLTASYNAQSKEIKILVNGSCSTCENRIESALQIEGVELADWNLTTKICVVKFNSAKISEDEIHKAIALAGHDTPKYKAEEDKYQELQSICKYKRIYEK